MNEFPIGLPVEVTGHPDMNVYVFRTNGVCIAEMQRCYRHSPLKGKNVNTEPTLNPQVLPAWEQASKGKGAAWIAPKYGEQSFAGFIPYTGAPRIGTLLVLGFAILLGRGLEDYIKASEQRFPEGVPRSVHHSSNPNGYIWNLDGQCISERQASLKHDSKVTLCLSDMTWLDPDIQFDFERALNLESPGWLRTNERQVTAAAFLPFPLGGDSADFVLELAAPLPEPVVEFFESEGNIPLRPL